MSSSPCPVVSPCWWLTTSFQHHKVPHCAGEKSRLESWSVNENVGEARYANKREFEQCNLISPYKNQQTLPLRIDTPLSQTPPFHPPLNYFHIHRHSQEEMIRVVFPPKR
ncbi:hypothetical protein OUZ56_009278 [Daphnia magna]|uniref:Uncharacterized protein n=1 Tax=Daphnia magna TaxID=35525 RepID=A0ABR0AFI6_9CRUS|nr:hypothetical protein OUZ56_009278 [Daphnia magna]